MRTDVARLVVRAPASLPRVARPGPGRCLRRRPHRGCTRAGGGRRARGGSHARRSRVILDARRRAGLARRPRQPRDRGRGSRAGRRGHSAPGGGATAPADGAARLPAARVPGRARHRHQRQDLGGPDDRRPARGGRTHDRYLHQPSPGAGQRADGARTASRSTTPPSTTSWWRWRRWRICSPTPPATSRSSPPPPCAGSADVAVDAAVVEVGLGGSGDATNVVDAAVAVVTNVSVDHVEYIGPTRRGHRGGEGRHREAGLDPRAGRDRPRLGAVLPGARRRAGRAARRRLRCARQPARGGRARARPVHAARHVSRGVPGTARRAPGRQRRGRARGSRVVPGSRARARDRHRRVPGCARAGAPGGRGSPAARVARRREERRRRARRCASRWRRSSRPHRARWSSG